jgi:replicative DNA helicase
MGKTALALNMARNTAVDFQIPVGFFSLEMSEKQLIQRLTSMETDIRSEKLRNADLEDYEWERINARTGKVINSNIYFDDTAAISILEFKAKARRMVSSHGVKLIIIDYLQLMRGTEKGRENREREVSEISQALKATAKELDIPIIAISQLSREVEKRLNKRPILSDLRESGSIEQDSDIVIFLYRPAYYMTEKDDGYDEFKRQLQISVAKHRNGQTRSDIMLDFIAEFTKITSPGYTETQIQAF